MRYQVKVYDVPRPREIDGKPIQQKPKLMKEFMIMAGNVDKCRRALKEKISKQENMFRGKEFRSLCFSPDPAPAGSVVVYVQTARETRGMTRSARALGR